MLGLRLRQHVRLAEATRHVAHLGGDLLNGLCDLERVWRPAQATISGVRGRARIPRPAQRESIVSGATELGVDVVQLRAYPALHAVVLDHLADTLQAL